MSHRFLNACGKDTFLEEAGLLERSEDWVNRDRRTRRHYWSYKQATIGGLIVLATDLVERLEQRQEPLEML
jgi:hypothetical protein